MLTEALQDTAVSITATSVNTVVKLVFVRISTVGHGEKELSFLIAHIHNRITARYVWCHLSTNTDIVCIM